MRHFANPRFWQCYRALPRAVQDLADDSYRLLLRDSKHPSLHFKKIGQFWSVRVGMHYRALAVEHEQAIVWFWIGPHSHYDRLIGPG